LELLRFARVTGTTFIPQFTCILKKSGLYEKKLLKLLGLLGFMKIEILYRETDWELISDRRCMRNLLLFYNVVNKTALIMIISP
jgi:hypothetical protein